MRKITNVRSPRPVLAVPVMGHGGRTGDAVPVGHAATLASAKALAHRQGFDVLARGRRFHGVADWSGVHPDAWVVSVSGKARRRKRNEADSPGMRSQAAARRAKPNGRGAASLDAFTRAYVDAALSELDDDGRPFDRDHDARDIDARTLLQMRRDAASFQRNNRDDLAHGDDDLAGYLFWHNRNGAGVGFWDGRWPGPSGRRLSDAAHAFGTFDFYRGDDGKLHGSPLGRKATQTGRKAKPNRPRRRA